MRTSALPVILSLIFLGVTSSWASEEVPQAFTLDGRLYSNPATKTALLDTGTFKIQILDFNGTCVLYEESQAFDTRGTDGRFNINIGEKSSGTVKRTAGDSGHTLAKVFANNGGTISGKLLSNGAACSGAAAAGNIRSIQITVIPDSDPTPRVMTPFALNSVPSAIAAERAESLEGIKASGFLQVNNVAPFSLSQSNLENIFSTTNYTKLVDILNGSTNLYVRSGANGTIQAPSISGTPATPAAGQIWYDAGTIKYHDGTTTQTLSAGSGITSLTIGTGLTPTGTITAGGSTIAVDTGVTAGKIVQVQTGGKLPALDGSDLTNVTASAFSSTGSISTSGSISANAANFRALTLTNAGSETITLNPAASITGSPISFTLPAAMPASNGYVLSSTTAGVMSWIAPATGGLTAVSNTASLAQGKAWIGDAGGVAQEKFIGMADIRSSQAGNAQFFPGSACSAGQTLSWQSGTDTLVCSNISLATSALTGSVSLTSQVSGVLPVTNGGTNSNTALNDNRLMVSSGGKIVEASAMTDGQIVVGKTSDAPQIVTMSGDATVSNTGVVTLKNTGTSGTYAKVTTDAQGRVTSGSALAAGDIPNLDWAKITSGKPTTLTGYGITDSVQNAGGTPSFQSGVDASKPSAGTAGRIYIATDTSRIYRDNGTTWDLIASAAGTGLAAVTAAADLANGKMWLGDAGGKAAEQTMSGDATITNAGVLTLKNTGTAGTYPKVTTDAQGRVTSGTTLSASDIPNLDWAKITSGTPTTLSGYGITNAVVNGGGTPSFTSGVDASKPAAGTAGRIYIASDTFRIYRDNGTTWDMIASAAGTGLSAVSNQASLADGKIWIGDGSGKSQEQAVSGDATISNTGVVTLKNTGTAGTYKSVTTDAQGRVTGGTNPTTLSGFGITDAILNAGNTVSIQSGVDASKPAAGTAGRVYMATDTSKIYRDNGTTWDTIASNSGTGISALTGDVTASGSGSVAATVARIQGVAVSSTTPTTTGQVLKYNGTTQYAPGFIGVADVRSTVAGNAQFFPTNCTSGQTLTWQSGTDTMICTNISIAGSQVSGVVLNGGQNGAVSAGTNDANSLTLKTNNTDRMTITSSGNIGIGMSNPSYKVDIQDSDASVGINISNSSSTTARYPGVSVQNYGGNGGAPQFNGIAFGGSGGSPQPVQNGEFLAHFSGSGGHTAGSWAYSKGAVIQMQASETWSAGSRAAKIEFMTTPTGSTSPSSRMLISSSGNVGIGTTNPGDMLHVEGKIRGTHICATDGTNCKDLTTAWTGGGGTVTSITAGTGLTGGTITGSGTIGLGTELAGVNALSTTGFVKRTGAGTYSTSTSIALGTDVTGTLPVANGGTGATTLTANQLLMGNGTSAVSTVTTANSAVLTTNGSGVPSWTQGSANTVMKSNGSAVSFGAVDLSTAEVTGTLPVSKGGTGVTSLAGTFVLNGGQAGAVVAGTTDANALKLKTNNVDRMTITSSGKVGIGTTSPQANLQVESADEWVGLQVKNRSSTTTQYPGIEVINYGGTAGGHGYVGIVASRGAEGAAQPLQQYDPLGSMIFFGQNSTTTKVGTARIDAEAEENFSGSTAATLMSFKTTVSGSTTPTERMRIGANGRVGIGTSAPGASLSVYDSTSNYTAVEIENNMAAGAWHGAALDLVTYGTDQTDYSTSAISLVTKRGAKGSTSAMQAGDMLGAMNFKGSKSSSASGDGVSIKGEAAGAFTATSTPGNLYFATTASGSTSPANRMVIRSTGNVGIGTSNPGDLLHVEGKIRGTHICATDGTNCKDLTTAWTGGGGTVTSITAGTGLTGGTITGSGTIGLGTELAGVAGLSTNGFVKRTGAGTYTTAAASLTADVSGVLPIANGGTNSSTALNNNRLMISSGGAIVEAGAMANGQIVVGSTGVAPQIVTMSGDATVSNTGVVTLKNTGTAGTYAKVTTDAQGRVTSGTTLSASDIPNLDWAKITSGTPTTLSGYGITNAVTNAGNTVSIQSGVDASKPAAGTAGRVYLATDTSKIYRDNGTTWDTIASNAGTGITALTGDVTASGSGSVAATVANVGGVTAANVASGANAANAATNNNTVSTIVKRDSNGDFSSRDVSLNSLILRGSTSGTLTQRTPATTTSYTVTWPAAVPGVAGYVLSSDTSGNLSWIAPTTGSLTAVSNSANLALGKIWIGDGTGKAQEQSVSGDATLSSAGAIAVTKIQGTAVSSSAPGVTGQVLRYNGTQWAPSMISMFDLRSTVTGNAAFGGVGCLSNQTLTWTAATDNLACSNISLPTSQVTGTLPVANGGTGVTSLPGTFVLNGGQAGSVTAGPSDANLLALQTSGTARMTILSSGNVGIGTTNPAALLHVSSATGDGDLTISSAATNGGAGVNLQSRQGGVTKYSWMNSDWPGNLQFGSSTGEYYFWNAGASSMHMTIKSTGHVGIGTSSPARRLHVEGAMRLSATTTPSTPVAGDMFIDSAASNALKYYNGSAWVSLTSGGGSDNLGNHTATTNLQMSGNSIIGNTTSAGNLTLSSTSHATKGYILMNTSGGNVGIGTTTPTSLLEVAGRVHMASRTSTVRDSTGTAGWYKLGTVKASASGGSRFKISILGSQGYENTSDKFGETIIHGSIGGDNSSSEANIRASFYHLGANPVVTAVKFVQGVDRFTYDVRAYVDSYSYHSYMVDTDPEVQWIESWASSSDPGANSTTVRAAYNQMTIASGNVGIGTTSPNAMLSLWGTTAKLSINTTGDATNQTRWTANNWGPFTYLRKSRGASIGTNAVVQQNDDLGGFLFQGDDGSAFQSAAMISGHVDGSTISGTSMPGRLSFWTTPSGSVASSERMRITNSGNVGIGTTAPAGALDVASTTGAFVPPRMTTTERDALTSPPDGSVIYNTTTSKMNFREAGAWKELSAGGGGGGSDLQVFTSSGTWTKPATGSMAFIQCWGGGGSGGKGPTSTNGGGGGGGGGYTEFTRPLSTLPATVTVTIGAGGAARTSISAGAPGGDSTFGSYLTAYGGGGGGSNSISIGGAGGGGLAAGANESTTGAAPLTTQGGGGSGNGAGVASSTNGGGGGGGAGSSGGGAGGASVYGGGGGGGTDSGDVKAGGLSQFGGAGGASGTSGTAGTQPGGGGGGATSSGNSGAGAAGACRVTVY